MQFVKCEWADGALEQEEDGWVRVLIVRRGPFQ